MAVIYSKACKYRSCSSDEVYVLLVCTCTSTRVQPMRMCTDHSQPLPGPPGFSGPHAQLLILYTRTIRRTCTTYVAYGDMNTYLSYLVHIQLQHLLNAIFQNGASMILYVGNACINEMPGHSPPSRVKVGISASFDHLTWTQGWGISILFQVIISK